MSRARLAVGILLLILSAGLYRGLIDHLPVVVHDAGDRPENDVRIWGGRSLAQTIVPPPPNLSGVELYLQPEHAKILQGPIGLHLRATPDGPNLRSATVDASGLRRGTFARFTFAPIDTRGDESAVLVLEHPAGTPERPLVVRVEQPRPDGQPWNDYPNGFATLSDQRLEGDLAFRLLSLGRRPFGTQTAAAAALGGLALVTSAVVRTQRTTVAALVLGTGLPLVFGLPLLRNPEFLGARDWDMNTTLHAAAARALTTEHAFPGWNPYLCGGTPLATFPESPVLSPFFGAALLGGPVLGFKVNVLLHLAAGYLGMLTWLRKGWRCSWLAAFLGAAVVTFSSFVALHIAEGHTRKIAIAWIPWVLYFFQAATDGSTAAASRASRLRSAALSGAAVTLMLLDGSVYLSIYTAVLLVLVSVVMTIQQRRLAPAAYGMIALLLGGLLAGAHVIPAVVSHATIHPTLDRAASRLPLRALIDVFLDPNQKPNLVKFDGQSLPWSEYGAYVGVASLALGVLGIASAPRRLLPWMTAGAFFLLGAFVPTSQRLLDVVPLLGDLRNPQRMAGMVTIVIGLAVAVGLDRLLHYLSPPATADGRAGTPGAARAAVGVLTALMIGHLMFVSTDTFAETFNIPPPPREDAPFQQGWARQLLGPGRADSIPFTVENTARNRGSVNRCSVAGVRPGHGIRIPPGTEAPREFTNEPYLGEAFIPDGAGEARATAVQTAAVTVTYEANRPATIVLNQNYHPGWYAELARTDGVRAAEPAFAAHEGLVGFSVPAGSANLRFFYSPPFLGVGIAVSGIGLALFLWLLAHSGGKDTPAAPQEHRHG